MCLKLDRPLEHGQSSVLIPFFVSLEQTLMKQNHAQSFATRTVYVLFGLFVATLWLWGGSSRADERFQLFVRCAAIVLAVVPLSSIRGSQIPNVRPILFFLVAFALLISVQLVPLPPAIWAALPGRADFVTDLRVVGLDQQWRPLNLMPDMGLNALAALIPAACMVILFTYLPTSGYGRICMMILVAAAISGLLGLLQLVDRSPTWYFYRTDSFGASGIFANRNHQALLLSLALPLIAAKLSDRGRKSDSLVALFAAVGGTMAMLLLLLVTGSRSGLVLGVFGFIGGVIILIKSEGGLLSLGQVKMARIAPWLFGLAGILTGAIVILAARAEALQRLLSEDISQELRIRLFGPLIEILWTYFPLGSGFGSFVELYKVHEPFSELNTNYLNHAHNDLLELIIEGGAPAVLLVAIFFAWYLRRSVALWSTTTLRGPNLAIARASSVNIGLIILASLSDYPLRTPMLSALFLAFACIVASTGQPKHSDRSTA